MRNFVNFDLGAVNVATMPVDAGIVAEFAPLIGTSQNSDAFVVVRPKWNSDLQWVSAGSIASFEHFQSAFDRLGVASTVAEYLDLDLAPRLYAGFLVIRSRCSAPNFHLDWVDTGNEAFTFMTPITGALPDFGLLYDKVNGTIGDYAYRPGEGILFGDGFRHSTKPGHSDEPVALLCFTFGTDKMKHWDSILRTAGYQSKLVQQPDGSFAALEDGVWRSLSNPAT